MNPDERYEFTKKDFGFMDAWVIFNTLSDKGKEDFLKLARLFYPGSYFQAQLGEYEKKCFCKG